MSDSLKDPQLAFYYPNPVWRSSEWVKNLILFFDGIALLVPEYMLDKPFEADPAIAEGLRRHGLLKILKPETFIDKDATQHLADSMGKLIEAGVFDKLSTDAAFHEISWSRLGGYADERLAENILNSLEQKRLARRTEDGVSIPMHPLVRAIVLVLLSQILRRRGQSVGIDLQPATDRQDIQDALKHLLNYDPLPSVGRVVSLDVEAVGVDLSSIPIDEVLDFRKSHQREYRSYARDLRKFVRELSLLDDEQRLEAMRDRREEIEDRASDLRGVAHKAFGGSSLLFGIAGAAWSFAKSDILGGVFGLAAIGSEALAGDAATSEAYSYLFRARDVLA